MKLEKLCGKRKGLIVTGHAKIDAAVVRPRPWQPPLPRMTHHARRRIINVIACRQNVPSWMCSVKFILRQHSHVPLTLYRQDRPILLLVATVCNEETKRGLLGLKANHPPAVGTKPIKSPSRLRKAKRRFRHPATGAPLAPVRDNLLSTDDVPQPHSEREYGSFRPMPSMLCQGEHSLCHALCLDGF